MLRVGNQTVFTQLLLALLVCCLGLTRTATADEPTADEPTAEAQAVSQPRDIYLLIGQSNMAGRAPFTAEQAKVIPGAWLLNGDDEWEPAKNPLNRYSTIRKSLSMQKMNPGFGFALAMTEENQAANIGLVVNAKGGTSIKLWAKGTQFYNEAVRRTKVAQKTGTLRGVLWHQGESDRNDEKYIEKLATLVRDLRKDLNEPKLPFVAGQIIDGPQINKQIRHLPSAWLHTGYVSSEGLTAFDRAHFDTASMLLLGQRYAAEIKRLHAQAAD